MRTELFDYVLPPAQIAQHPQAERSGSRMMVFDRRASTVVLSRFVEFPNCLRAGDLLVLNDSRVIPARLHGCKVEGGGRVEILLLRQQERGAWWVLLKPGKRVRAGTRLRFPGQDGSELRAVVGEKADDGRCLLAFDDGVGVLEFAEKHGELPLPPYIARETPDSEDRERYQTVYARVPGSIAAPTAGLHLSPEILAALRGKGVEVASVTLHVGLGTFAPVKAEDVSDHVMHSEEYVVPSATADAVVRAKGEGRRVVAVGTTSLRVLESAARSGGGEVRAGSGSTNLFLHPPATFRVVDVLLTNFHLPRSTLLMLVCAFAAPGSESGREPMLAAYRRAVEAGFRFFSYGDAMLIH
ncbi:MAG: tRNA preQ1(34) S-adenosylmethionine ribosyltransferase-isomerase QueA [Verrucomicrobiales bacterium]|nr:tRNA preQ1(34) S-adenosylmethionine ribosyltransferase-isomerase QueA [Verrucomicrobiales bacterium]